MFSDFCKLPRIALAIAVCCFVGMNTQSASAQFLDFNFDGQITSADMDILVHDIGTCYPKGTFVPWDLCHDGCINMGSLEPLGNTGYDYYATNGDGGKFLFGLAVINQRSHPYLPGDANLDGVVDGIDFIAWNNNKFGPGCWSEGDWNGDGIVDGLDFILWNTNKWSNNN